MNATTARTFVVCSLLVSGFVLRAPRSVPALGQSKPELIRYVSPPLDGRGTRVSFYVPAGWTMEPAMGLEDRKLRFRATTAILTFVPHKEAGRVFVSVGPSIPRKKPWLYDGKTKVYQNHSHEDSRVGRHLARRGFLSGDGRYWVSITHHRDDRSAFNATARRICAGLRLVNARPKVVRR
jgi:hypothetical protein